MRLVLSDYPDTLCQNLCRVSPREAEKQMSRVCLPCSGQSCQDLPVKDTEDGADEIKSYTRFSRLAVGDEFHDDKQ